MPNFGKFLDQVKTFSEVCLICPACGNTNSILIDMPPRTTIVDRVIDVMSASVKCMTCENVSCFRDFLQCDETHSRMCSLLREWLKNKSPTIPQKSKDVDQFLRNQQNDMFKSIFN